MRSYIIKTGFLMFLFLVFLIFLLNIQVSNNINYSQIIQYTGSVNFSPNLNTKQKIIPKYDEIYAWIPHFDFRSGLESAISNKSKLKQVHLSGASVDANGDVIYSSNFESNIKVINENNIVFGINIISANPKNTSAFLKKSHNKLFADIERYKKFSNFKSVNLNLENLYSEDTKRLLDFLREFKNFLNINGMQLFVTIYPKSKNSNSGYTSDSLGGYEEIIQYTDYLVIMFYDSYKFTQTPGNCPFDWYNEGIDLLTNEVKDLDKVIVGLPLFGYGFDDYRRTTRSYTYSQIQNIAKSPSMSSNFEMMHRNFNETIFFQDSNTLKIRKQYAKDKFIYKFFYWRLGGENGLEL